MHKLQNAGIHFATATYTIVLPHSLINTPYTVDSTLQRYAAYLWFQCVKCNSSEVNTSFNLRVQNIITQENPRHFFLIFINTEKFCGCISRKKSVFTSFLNILQKEKCCANVTQVIDFFVCYFCHYRNPLRITHNINLYVVVSHSESIL